MGRTLFAAATCMRLMAGGALGATAFTLIAAPHAAHAQAPAYSFDQPAQPMADALRAFARASGQQITFDEATVRGKRAPALRGRYAPGVALGRLLAGSGLEATRGSSGIFIVRTARTVQGASGSRNDPRQQPRLERADEPIIIVTGTNIRGVENSSSPLVTVDREDIEAAGFSTTEDVVRSLSQNFDGGASENTLATVSGGGDSANSTFGTGVNLRGLGNDSTLVLINGRRLAAGNIGNFVDISMIPLSAVDRVDVVADGASAIYGSDAVGGVINFILREDYSGAETRIRYGTVTDGESDRITVGQILGHEWGSGDAIISVEYSERSALDTQDRSVTVDAPDPSFLLPNTNKFGLLAGIRQDISSSLRSYANVVYSDRETFSSISGPSTFPFFDVSAEQFSFTGGFLLDFADDWQLDLGGSYSRSESEVTRSNETTFGFLQNIDSELWSVDAKVDGPLFELPGGPARLAVGFQYRAEGLRSSVENDVSVTSSLDIDRDIYALFAEASIPLVGESNAVPFIERLELSLSARLEDYSEFSSSTDPKIGLLWSPTTGLNFRGTYGTSFRAPTLTDLNSTGGAVIALPGAFFPNSPGNILFLNGPNSNLGPENATTISLGFDYRPPQIPGLELSATYYDVDFRDRIAAPLRGGASFSVFLNQEIFASIIESPADTSRVNGFAADPQFENPFGIPLDSIAAIVDLRTQNLASTNTDGLDFRASYSFDSSIGSWVASINGTYIFNFENRVIPSAPANDVLNTTFNPVDLNLRAGLSWRLDHLSVNGFINYVDGYSNTLNVVTVPIESWTTVDLTASYRVPAESGIFQGTRFSLAITNLFDREPPFVQNELALNGFNFDGANANALGRFVSFQITKEW